ncbi:deleted in malignant brain tumors 1 protein-like [Scomber scombrus]|uniref:deleted in malignant brain tumors 1 protein-like n=1 Tax=Scomber scombrus TaxID=13677 RepID=UPI002DD9C4ED|nr:deleted in malignant brain tumors 1 protein-like [Scomber scombrus]
MIYNSAKMLHLCFYLSVGLLSLPLLTECEKIKLVGPSRCSGRVEVYHRDSWGTVCDDNWNIASAEVTCRELKCGTVLEAKKSAFFGEGKEDIWLDDVVCTGHESSILSCQHRPIGENNCGHNEDAGVVCSEFVRLVNGSNRCSGRVEVYHEGHWKKVCRSNWREEDAEVLCREISCGTPATQSGAQYFGEGSDTVGIKTNCFGNESSLSECALHEFKEGCDDATVICANNKPIRLVNGSSRCSGRVEVYHEGQWGTVCDDKWGMQEAAVACREMNCGVPLSVKYKAFFGRGQDQVWMDDVECTGNEKSLAECPHRGFGEHDCDHHEDAGIICSETIRLSNGTDRCSGSLQVFHDSQWGRICDNNWSQKDTAMVCRELACGDPKKTREIPEFGNNSELKGYTSTCSGNVSSINQCTLDINQGRCRGVSIACQGNPPLRLANGTDRCSGRVEILHDGQWGTVCDDEWDIRDAQVVCRAMDCGTAQTSKPSAFFGMGAGPIWLDDVGCIGNETSLLHCRRPSFGENNCGHGEDAGVMCSATIRLINGTDQCSGRVEVHHGGNWAPVHSATWGMNEATVVCREMDCGDAGGISGSFGQGEEIRGYKITCNGRETSVTQCTLREYVKTSHDNLEDASVICTGNAKLSGGHNRCVGRVEFFDQGQWGNVCGESWDMNDANVVCKQLNCGRAHTIATTAAYGLGTGQTVIDRIECNGIEATMSQCQRGPFRDRTCNTTSVAGVVCTGSLEARLDNGNDECNGRVEVRHGETWQTVCDTDWTLNKAEMVCQLLECGRAINNPGRAHFGQGRGTVVEASDSCFSNVSSIQQCSVQGFRTARCGHEHDAGVVCAAQVRLVSGSNECSGRVEVLYKGQWGTVCDDEWELSNADVVCRQLGCGHAVAAPTSAHFGRGSGPIWLDNVDCSGQEPALTRCTHAGFGENNCGHGEDAGVICLGALEKPQITLSPSPEVTWGERVEVTCTILTEHLGGKFILRKNGESFKMERFTDNEAATFVLPSVDFDQRGSYFCEYQKKLPNQVIYYPQGNIAELSVTVKIEIPSISMTSPHAMVVYRPDKISVPEGSSFSITCSIHSKYRDGFFYLTKSNKNISESKPAFGHSVFYLAYFEFPAIQYNQQGDYSCVYGVNISSMTFSSVPSKSLLVTVVSASSSTSVAVGVVVGLLLLLLLVIGYVVWRRRLRGSATMVQFSNRFGGAVRQGMEDKGNGALDGRNRNTQMNERAESQISEDKIADFDSDNVVERVPEDLAGRVCYELEPLVLS